MLVVVVSLVFGLQKWPREWAVMIFGFVGWAAAVFVSEGLPRNLEVMCGC
jgi:hypothetical protein